MTITIIEVNAGSFSKGVQGDKQKLAHGTKFAVFRKFGAEF